jgi:hypothetical protein
MRTHLADPKTTRPVCSARGFATIVAENPTCTECQSIQRDYPRLLWTDEQWRTFNENFIATFRGGK